jgi:hypothetical protein
VVEEKNLSEVGITDWVAVGVFEEGGAHLG